MTMAMKARTWQLILIGLSAVNVVAVGFAASDGEPWHAGGHAALALVLGLWAQRLRSRAEADPDTQGEVEPRRVDLLEHDVAQLRQELGEAQERLDFAERVLVKGRQTGHAPPERGAP
jgi:hypothetical protein